MLEKMVGLACQKYLTWGGAEALGLPGTSTRKDVLRIVGKWGLERIINALMIHMEVDKPVGKYFDLVREKSTQKSRTLT